MHQYKILLDSARWECSPNLITCSRLHDYFVANGHTIVQELTDSDYIIINSCGVTDRGKNRTLNIVRKYIEQKKDDTTILLFGCLIDIEPQVVKDLNVITIGLKDSQRLDALFSRSKLFREIQPFCDDTLRTQLVRGKHSTAVTPTTDPLKIALLDLHPFLFSFPLVMFFPQARKRFHQIRNRFTNTMYVEISKGCTGRCNYCLVRKAKGTVRSREIPEILSDIERLYDPSKDLYLVADDCGCYGVDKGSSIIELLDAIYGRFPDIRLKLNYIDPRYLLKHSEDFLRIFGSMHITSTMIPLQSGSQKVLKQMNRDYDAAEILKFINKIRTVSPSTFISSHFIVGHPGETWNEYRRTLAAARFFDYPAPFSYSNNKGTASAAMKNQVPRSICFLRYAFFILFLNVIVLFRIADASKTRRIK